MASSDEFDFLQGCLARACTPLRNGLDITNAVPFVRMTLVASGREITVGNNSDPSFFNYAAITSFKMNALRNAGFTMNFTITDEAGGKFDDFYRSVTKTPDLGKPRTRPSEIEVKWGWMGTSCNNQPVILGSAVNNGTLMTIDTSFVNGLVKFELEVKDPNAFTEQMTSDETIGKDGDVIGLKQAIINLCKKYYCEVKFLSLPDLGGGEWDFKEPEPEGKWEEKGMNLVQTIMNWVKNYTAEDGSGIFPMFDSNGPKGNPHKLILWAYNRTSCNKILDPCKFGLSLGTYVVNGGKYSPVLEFSPKLSANFVAETDANKTTNTKKEDDELNLDDEQDCNMTREAERNGLKVGFPVFNVLTENAMRTYGLKNALRSTREAVSKNIRANIPVKPLEADLKIIGDPSLSDFSVKASFVTVIVNNPYHFTQQGFQKNEGDWLQAEPCHTYYSSKKWLVQGFAHEISSGKYTTTLQLILDLPGFDSNVGLPIGNEPGAIIPEEEYE